MKKNKDWVPSEQAKFFTFQGVFVAIIVAAVAAGLWGITEAAKDVLVALQQTFIDAWNAYKNPKTRNELNTNAKNTAMKALKTGIRDFTSEHIRNNSMVPKDKKLEMGLPDPDTKPSPAPVPSTNPVLQIDTADVARHKVLFKNEAPDDSRAKPLGVDLVEIRYKVNSPAPVGPGECTHTIIAKRSPKLIVFASKDSGKRVWYFARWVNTLGEPGPWSTRRSAIIT